MRMRKSNIFTLLELILLLLVLGPPSHAIFPPKERITGFSSYIRVHTDGSLTVTEEIKVISAHISIKRGAHISSLIDRTFRTWCQGFGE